MQKIRPLKEFSLSAVPQEEIAAVFAELKNATDRAAAVQLGAYVECMLTHTLMNRIKSNLPEKIKQMILRATFQHKNIGLLHLGIIDDDTHQNLEIIREIRNAFAHSPRGITFETPQVVEAVQGLKEEFKQPLIEGIDHLTPARRKFTSSCYRSIFTVVFRTVGKKLDLIGRVLEVLKPHLNEELKPEAERVARSAQVLKDVTI